MGFSFFKQRERGGGAGGETVLYYASDVHGSDPCWRKFVGAAAFYKADALIMGGDLCGKAIVPIVGEEDGSRSAQFLGERRVMTSDAELAELIDAIRFNGFYAWQTTAEEASAFSSDATAQSELFTRIMTDDVARWCEIADAKLGSSATQVWVMAGNDDPWEVDAVIDECPTVLACDDRVVDVHGHEMISCSYANRTPWNSPRELDEDALYARIKRLAEQLEAPERAIFNLHVPPYDSGLDTARKINPDLTLVMKHGEPVEAPVGSQAVRQVIEEYQPMLALHGHIHESRGAATIGRTLALNSGSEYNTGRLHGVRVVLRDGAVKGHQFVVG